MAVTSDSKGYWLAGADGSVHAFGDAKFFGSDAGVQLSKPIVAIAVVDDQGYRLVAADGGIFDFGADRFWGSLSGAESNSPIAAMGAT